MRLKSESLKCPQVLQVSSQFSWKSVRWFKSSNEPEEHGDLVRLTFFVLRKQVSQNTCFLYRFRWMVYTRGNFSGVQLFLDALSSTKRLIRHEVRIFSLRPRLFTSLWTPKWIHTDDFSRPVQELKMKTQTQKKCIRIFSMALKRIPHTEEGVKERNCRNLHNQYYLQYYSPNNIRLNKWRM